MTSWSWRSIARAKEVERWKGLSRVNIRNKYWLFTFSKKEETFKENGLGDFLIWCDEGMTGKDERGLYFAYNQKNGSIAQGDKMIFAFTDGDGDPEHRWVIDPNYEFTSGVLNYENNGYKYKYYVKELPFSLRKRMKQVKGISYEPESENLFNKCIHVNFGDVVDEEFVKSNPHLSPSDLGKYVIDMVKVTKVESSVKISSSYISKKMMPFPMEIDEKVYQQIVERYAEIWECGACYEDGRKQFRDDESNIRARKLDDQISADDSGEGDEAYERAREGWKSSPGGLAEEADKLDEQQWENALEDWKEADIQKDDEIDNN